MHRTRGLLIWMVGLSFAAGLGWTAVVAGGEKTALPAQTKPAESVPKISNPLQPRDGIIKPKFEELWSVGGENDQQGELLNRPFEIRVAQDGSVFVLDWGDTCIRVFDDSGKFVRQIGRKGQGPGDFDTPSFFDLDAEGRPVVLDMRNLRVTRFDSTGKYEASFRLEKSASQVCVDSRGRVYCGESSAGEPQLSSEFKIIQRMLSIVRYDPDGRNPLRLGPFRGEKMMMKAMPGAGIMSASSPSSPQTGWCVAPDGRLWLGHNEIYELGVFDPDGKPLFRFGREFKPVRNKAYAEIALENRKNTVATEDFPAFVQNFFFDQAGNAWFRLFRNEEPKDEPYRYDVFSPEGVYLRQIEAPFRIYQVRNGKAYAIVDTEEGFKALKCFRFR